MKCKYCDINIIEVDVVHTVNINKNVAYYEDIGIYKCLNCKKIFYEVITNIQMEKL